MGEGLKGFRLVSFESRRAREMKALIENQGGRAFVAPSLKEVPLENNPMAFEFAERLLAGRIDILILLTGVGTRILMEALRTRYALEILVQALKRIVLIARGPKPKAALREIGLDPTFTAEDPNTWKEILALFDSTVRIQGKHIAVQEYGKSHPDLVHALEERGGEVFTFPVYRWALPDDAEPLQEAIRQISNQEADIVLWTNAQQIRHVMQTARTMRLEEEFRRGLKKSFIASVGPTMTEALLEFGFSPDFEPSQTKMGILVSELSNQGGKINAKRQAVSRGEGNPNPK